MPRRRVSLGRVFRRKGRPGYYVRVRSDGREVVRYAGPDRGIAAERAAQVLQEHARAKWLGERPIESRTFADVRTDFLASLKARHAGSTYGNDVQRFDRCSVQFGATPLRDIDAGSVADFLTGLRSTDELAPASVNRFAALLSVAFKWATERGYARSNPVAGFKRLKEAERSVPYQSEGDVQRLVSASREPDYSTLIRVLADTGLRRSEALALQWRDVDSKRQVLTVRNSKSHEPRQVPLTGAALAALAQQAERAPVIPLRGPDPVWPALVTLQPASISDRFRTIARRAGFPHLRLHDLRHGFASRLTQAGVPLPTVARLCGHKVIATTMRYAKHSPEGALRAAIDVLDGVARGKAAESAPNPESVPTPAPQRVPTETAAHKASA